MRNVMWDESKRKWYAGMNNAGEGDLTSLRSYVVDFEEYHFLSATKYEASGQWSDSDWEAWDLAEECRRE
jgi:hypothetical protein